MTTILNIINQVASCRKRLNNVENTHGNKSVHNVPAHTMERMKSRFSVSLGE